jgi:hypothetical protein
MKLRSILPLAAALVPHTAPAAEPATWQIPAGGNAYLTAPADGGAGRVDAAGIRGWTDKRSVFSIYFRADRAAALDLSLRLGAPAEGSVIRASVAGQVFEKPADAAEIELGKISVKAPGYIKLDLQGVRKSGATFAEVAGVSISSSTPGLTLDYVNDNQDNHFYWGRRGPSVHLPYELPEGETIEYFYNEVTVPEGRDPVGSYFMANGFGEGYFGMQVNGEKERRVLFSVWSPFTTDNPKDIPADHKVELLAKGGEVRGGEFGGEGSGGQSYLLYPWKAGATYRFLNRVHPDGAGRSVYTAWFFAPETGKWRLIASFRRPKTDKWLTGAHSFLENFADRNGYLGRAAMYGNQWVRTSGGKWLEVLKASFSGDDIASRGFRLDFAGGVSDGQFFLRNGGFFDQPVKLGSKFERKPTGRPPAVDLEALEGNS